MATVYLDRNETWIAANDASRVYGRPAGNESVTLSAGVTGVELDGNVEEVGFSLIAGDTELGVNEATGRLEIRAGGDTLASFSSGLEGPTELAFSDGTAVAQQVGATRFELRSSRDSTDVVSVSTGTSQAGNAAGLDAAGSPGTDQDTSGLPQHSSAVPTALIQSPEGNPIDWIWATKVDVTGFASPIVIVHGAPKGQANLNNTTPTPLLFFSYEDGEVENITGKLNQDSVSSVITRDILVDDLNGDGLDDIFLNNHGTERFDPFPGERNQLLAQTAEGGFADGTSGLPNITDFSHGSSIGDFNDDGLNDLFINNLGDDDLTPSYFLYNEGEGQYSKPVAVDSVVENGIDFLGHTLGAAFTEAIDINNDDRADVFLGEVADNQYAYLENKGAAFDFVIDENLAWAGSSSGLFGYRTLDFNMDGRTDILAFGTKNDLINDSGVTVGGRLQLELYENVAGGSVERVTDRFIDLGAAAELSLKGGLDAEVIDLTGNGLPDLEIRAWNSDWEPTRLTFENVAEAHFQSPVINNSGIAAPRAEYVDWNDDGTPDLVRQDGKQIAVHWGLDNASSLDFGM